MKEEDGIAEEVLYNIKKVISFGNFDFERQRFGHYNNLVHELDKQSGFKLVFFYYYGNIIILNDGS